MILGVDFMKIGILTFHMAHNCGAMLQAFALCSFLNSFPNTECEIIDYRLPDIYTKYEFLLSQPYVEPKRFKFEKYLNDVLPISSRITDISLAKPYDLYIVGSDQVWNPNITKGYKDEYFAKKFPPQAFCISYAASSGVKIEDVCTFSKKLSYFRYVSVRESWLQEDLAPFNSEKVTLCLDPVFLIEKQEWDSHIGNFNLSKYVLIYSFDMTEEEYDLIENWATKNQLPIIELITHKRKKRTTIQYFDNYGPKEWLNYIKNSSYIFTDSYHGSVFSIIYNNPFYCLSHGRRKNERIYDILQRLHIQCNDIGFYYPDTRSLSIINTERLKSINYLKEIIGQVENEKNNI